MSKYLVVIIFYTLSALTVFLLDNFFPARGTDGGWSLSALGIIVLSIVVAIWMVVSVVKGFTNDKSHFIIALIHLIVLTIVAKKIFGLY